MLIAFRHFPEKHTSANISTRIEGILDEFGLSSKIVTETSDAGANIKKAIQQSSKLEWVNCLAHLLNLVSKKVLEEPLVSKFIQKCRKLVGTFKHSNTMSYKLKEKMKKK
jgi:hypothetical protein